jgi:hypothetical protein
MMLIHAHSHGAAAGFFREVALHSLLDTLNILPFLFLTYVLMEYLEHHAATKMRRAVEKCGPLAPLVGGALGAIPQCGFSSAAASLYAGRTISLGTLIAVFLSTSDEMLPILISANAGAGVILTLVLSKVAVGIAAGFLINAILKLRGHRHEAHIHELCESEGCHCERGIWLSALYHTLTVALFILLATLAIDSLVYFAGEEALHALALDIPVLSQLACALIGLIPNCAVSVLLTELYLEGVLSAGALLAGLLPNAGVGTLVLLRTNKSTKENIFILALLAAVGFLFGLIFDLSGLSALLTV